MGAERATVMKAVAPNPHTTYDSVNIDPADGDSKPTPIPATSASGAERGQSCGKPVQFTVEEHDIMVERKGRDNRRKRKVGKLDASVHRFK